MGKNSIADFGDPKEFLGQINYLFGDQVFSGALLDLFPMDKTLSIKREYYFACDTVVALLAKADEKQHTMWLLGESPFCSTDPPVSCTQVQPVIGKGRSTG